MWLWFACYIYTTVSNPHTLAGGTEILHRSFQTTLHLSSYLLLFSTQLCFNLSSTVTFCLSATPRLSCFKDTAACTNKAAL